MSHVDYHPAELNKEQLDALQAVEQDLGVTLVAFSRDDKPAELSEEQLKRVKSLEECLGSTIIAY